MPLTILQARSAQSYWLADMPRLFSSAQASNAVQSLHVKPLSQHEAEGQPHDLWDRAYEILREDKDSRKLMDAYEKILLSELKDDHSFPAVAEDTGTSTREIYMSALVEKKVKAVEDARWKFQLGERTIELKIQIDRIVKAILFAKDFVSSAVSAEPHAALAWAGVCMLLPLLLNPGIQNKALVEGLDYISSLVVRFTTIERLYRQQGFGPKSLLDQDNFEELNRTFEAELTKLYTRILKYQAQVVCQMHRHTFIRNGRDILKLDDWSTLLDDIKKAEAACTGISQVVSSEKLEATLKDLSRRLDLLLFEHGKQYYELQRTADHILTGVEHLSKEQQQWHRTDEESRCLQALCTSTYEDHKDRNPPRVPGTCLWFLKNQRFDDWLARDSSDLLWVTADPGCGKSVLARSLVDHELQSGPSRTTCYFFFKDIGEQRSATNAISALLHQLCTQDHSVLQQIVRVYQSNGNRLTLSFSWLWKAFLAATSRSEAGEIVCILDALDECEEQDRFALIESLNNFYTTRSGFAGCAKFLVTSRPYYDIEDHFDELVIRLTGEDESEQIGQEIDLVIKDRVPKIAARKKFDRKTQDALQERLLASESRTYLWLYLALADIEKAFGITNAKKMREFVDRVPKSVDGAYEAMLNRSPQPEQAWKLLHIILAAVEPLNLREVNMAFNLEEGQKSYEDVDLIPDTSLQSHIKNVCGLMLTIYDSKLYFLHQTAKEFLVASSGPTPARKHLVPSPGAWKHTMEPSESNFILAKACITYLLFSIFESEPLKIQERRGPVRSTYIEKHYFLSYAAHNWPAHFRLAKDSLELSLAWYDICNIESKRFGTWTNACYGHPCRRAANSFEVACSLGHDTIVRQLLGASTDLEKYHGTYDGTVLACAARDGHNAVVDVLISHGASINTSHRWGHTPLFWGVDSGSETVVKSLLQAGASVDTKVFDSQTCLYVAADRGWEGIVRILLCNGASLNTTDDQGRTPLFSAVKSESVNIVNMMLDKGASTDVRDHERWTPIMYAAWINSGRMVKTLLQKTQDAYFSDLTTANLEPDGEHIQELMSNIILREASSLDTGLSQGMTVLHWAAKHGWDKIVQKLLEKGASLDIRDNVNSTALVLAVVERHTKVVRILLAHGASTDVRNFTGLPPLMLATFKNQKDLVQILLENGAPVDFEDNRGQTALHFAAERGWKEITQMLVDAGADPNALDKGRLKPLDLAKQGGHQAVVELLEPLTNDDYEYPYSDDGTENDDHESIGARSYKPGEDDQANTQESGEEPSHQVEFTVRPKDPTQAE